MEYVLLSGGLDSSAMAHVLKSEGRELRAIYIDHGQRASTKELASAFEVSQSLEIPLKVIDVSGMWPSFRDIAEPTHIHLMTSSGITASPGIGIAATYAALAGADGIHLGLIREDLEGRPWLPDLLGHYQAAIRCVKPSLKGFPPGDAEYSSFKIEAPVSHLSKAELISKACALGATTLSNTWSCQFSSIQQCGVCFICNQRKLAFAKAQSTDLTSYTS